MTGHINIDEEIARDLLAEELKKAPKNVKDAKAFEEYCKKNLQQPEKESMKFSFLASIVNFFKKSKPTPLITVTPLQASVESTVQPSSENNTLETPLLISKT